MAKIYGQLEKAQLELLSSAPVSPQDGMVYWDTTLGYARVYQGGTWRRVIDSVGAAASVPSTPSGNLAATNLQDAVNELQSDIDTRALDSDFDAHTAATAAHGVDGNVVGTSDTQTMTNKTIGDALTLAPIATPAAPASGLKVYAKSNDKLYFQDSIGNEKQVGSGAGGGGINLLVLDSAWQIGNTDNADAETSVGNWATYDDGAVSAPVDMTAGTAGITLSRTTTAGEVLNGAGSLKISKPAADHQGEGISCVAYVPAGYRSSKIKISFPFKVTSGSIAEDVVKLYAYDVTNSEVITPFVASKVMGSQGIAEAYFDIKSTTAQLRVGLHIASTTTTAFDLCIDDVSCGPNEVAMSVPARDTFDFPMTFSALGTTTNHSIWASMVGDRLRVQGYAQAGTVAASDMELILPSGYRINTSAYGSASSKQIIGILQRVPSGAGPWVSFDSAYAAQLFYDGATNDRIFVSANTGSNILNKNNGNEMLASNEYFSFWFDIPLAGRSSNVQSAESSTFRISNFLANGTRVTATPSKLGEYRVYAKGASSFAGTDTTVSTAPSASNGMLIYAVPYGTAGTAGQPNRWEIFVGKNKQLKYEFYQSASRTGWVDTSIQEYSSETGWSGVYKSYDSNTGVLVLDTIAQSSSTTSRFVGWGIPTAGGAYTQVSNAYFDIVVSENALAVGAQSCRSYVRLGGGSGHGSTNTKIRRFTTVYENVGTAITVSQSSTLGDSFTINEDGVYAISYSDLRTTGASYCGLSKNSSQLTTNVESITAADRIARSYSAASATQHPNITTFLRAGDVIRAHTDGTMSEASEAIVGIAITKVNL